MPMQLDDYREWRRVCVLRLRRAKRVMGIAGYRRHRDRPVFARLMQKGRREFYLQRGDKEPEIRPNDYRDKMAHTQITFSGGNHEIWANADGTYFVSLATDLASGCNDTHFGDRVYTRMAARLGHLPGLTDEGRRLLGLTEEDLKR